MDTSQGPLDVRGFAAGARLHTPQGARDISDLQPGDRVLTRDAGFRPIRAIRRAEERRSGPLAPMVDLHPDTFANADFLCAAGTQRVLLTGAEVQMLAGVDECLAPLSDLAALPGVVPSDTRRAYFHVLLDRHEIIWVNGMWAESLFLGDVPMVGQGAGVRWLTGGTAPMTLDHRRTARRVLSEDEARVLVHQITRARHLIRRVA